MDLKIRWITFPNSLHFKTIIIRLILFPIKPWEIFVEIIHLTYREFYEVKVVMQPVKIIRTKDPFKPKKGKGKTRKIEWSSD